MLEKYRQTVRWIPGVSPGEEQEGFAEKESFKAGMKEWRGDGWLEWWVGGTSGRSATQRTEWVRIGVLVRGWRREAGSWFQGRGELNWKERSVIRKEDNVGLDGQASVAKDEERVLRGGWTVMRLCRYEGWVIARTLSSIR